MEKPDTRKLKPEVQQELRKQAIRLCKKGMTQREIAEILGVYPTSVSKWWRAYKKDGAKAIRCKKRGRPKGSCRTLTPDQEKEIQKAIYDKYPDQLKLPFTLWTRVAVQQLIKQLWSIDMPIRTVGEYLKRWGFTPKKSLKKAYRQNPKAVKKWLDEEYPVIKSRARKENAQIHWGDETGLSNDSYHGRSDTSRGQTPTVLLHPRCERVNLISSITNQGKVHFMIYREKMNSGKLIKFMRRLVKAAGRKVFLILDNLKIHHSHAVKAWLKEHADQIEVFFLPSYSPELNPDEYLNCDL